MSWFRSDPGAVLILLEVLVLSIAPAMITPSDTRAQTVEIDAGPNHYVVLIDASGSPVSTAPKARRYLSVLRDTLPGMLFDTGFGAGIPSYDPNTDLLSVFTFGVVPQERQPPRRYLSRHNLLTDFVHPSLRGETGVTRHQFVEAATPRQYYGFTLLGWSRLIGLWAARLDPADRVNRTFLVSVHDGESNEDQLSEETLMLWRWGDTTRVRQADDTRLAADSQFSIGPAKGDREAYRRVIEGPQAEIPSQRIFLEAFEVVSRELAEWEDAIRAQSLIETATVSWEDRGGGSYRGTVELTPRQRSFTRLLAGADATVAVELNEDADSATAGVFGDALVAQMELHPPQSLECGEAHSAGLTATWSVDQPTSWLGTRRIRVAEALETEGPTPRRCTVLFRAKASAAVIGMLLGMAAITAYLLHRFYTTPLTYEMSGHLGRFRIPRRGSHIRGTAISPKLGSTALTLRLPSPLVQQFVLRGARLVLPEAEALWWSREGVPTREVTFPIGAPRLTAGWEHRVPSMPTAVRMTFEQGRQQSHTDLHYPQGVTSRSPPRGG